MRMKLNIKLHFLIIYFQTIKYEFITAINKVKSKHSPTEVNLYTQYVNMIVCNMHFSLLVCGLIPLKLLIELTTIHHSFKQSIICQRF